MVRVQRYTGLTLRQADRLAVPFTRVPVNWHPNSSLRVARTEEEVVTAGIDRRMRRRHRGRGSDALALPRRRLGQGDVNGAVASQQVVDLAPEDHPIPESIAGRGLRSGDRFGRSFRAPTELPIRSWCCRAQPAPGDLKERGLLARGHQTMRPLSGALSHTNPGLTARTLARLKSGASQGR